MGGAVFSSFVSSLPSLNLVSGLELKLMVCACVDLVRSAPCPR